VGLGLLCLFSHNQNWQHGEDGMVRIEHRSGKERRSGLDRRKGHAAGYKETEHRGGKERRSGKDRRKSPPAKA
jgi:hypothetical protein